MHNNIIQEHFTVTYFLEDFFAKDSELGSDTLHFPPWKWPAVSGDHLGRSLSHSHMPSLHDLEGVHLH